MPYVSKYLKYTQNPNYSLTQGNEIKKPVVENKHIYNSKYLNYQGKKGLNPYFSFNNETYDTSNEVQLVKELQQEQIRMYGYNVTYILRTNHTIDELYGESIGSNFSNSFRIEVMPESPELMIGRDAIAAFGYSMTDTITLHVSFDRIIEEIKALNVEGRTYPIVGDLIAFDIPGNIMEVRYIEDKVVPFVKGDWTLYSLTCQVFNLGQETFTTDNPDIDFLNKFNETYEYNNMDNEEVKQEANNIISSEPNIWNLNFKESINYEEK